MKKMPLGRNFLIILLGASLLLFGLGGYGLPLPASWLERMEVAFGIRVSACRIQLKPTLQPLCVYCDEIEGEVEGYHLRIPQATLGFSIVDMIRGGFTPQSVSVDNVHIEVPDVHGTAISEENLLALYQTLLMKARKWQTFQFSACGLSIKSAALGDEPISIQMLQAHLKVDTQKVVLDLKVKNPDVGDIRFRSEASFEGGPIHFHVESLDLNHLLLLLKKPHMATLTAPLSGEVKVTLQNNLMDTQLNGYLKALFPGKIDVLDFYPQPLSYTGLKADISGVLGEMGVNVALETERPMAQFSIHLESSQTRGWLHTMALSGEVSHMPATYLPSHWPQSLGATTRSWVLKNLSEGEVTKATVGLVMEKEDNAFTMKELKGRIDLTNMTVSYMEGLPPVRHVDGYALYDDQHFEIHATSGVLDDLRVTKGFLNFHQLAEENGLADIDLSISGPLTQALAVADSEPLKYLSSFGFKADDATGHTDVGLNLSFPLGQDISLQRIKIKIQAVIQEMSLEKKFPAPINTVFFEKGNLRLALENKGMTLTGKIQVKDIPLQLKWSEFFQDNLETRRKIKMAMTLSPQDRKKLGLPKVEGVFGPVSVVVMSEEKRDLSNPVTVSLDFSSADLSLFPPFYHKPVGQLAKADIHFDARGKADQPFVFHIADKDGSLRGQAAFHKGEVSDITLSQARFQGSDLKARWTKGDREWWLLLEGDTLNLAPFLKVWRESKEKTPWSGTVTANLKKVKVSESESFSQVKGHATHQGDMWSRVNLGAAGGKKNNFSVKLEEKERTRKFTLRGDRSSPLFALLSDSQRLTGGKVQIDLTQEGTFLDPWVGNMLLDDLGIKDMPIITKILSVISPVAVVDLASGKGLVFGSLQTQFSLSQGHMLRIEHGQATSLALGITFKGNLNLDEQTLALEGDVIPAYLLNSLVGRIPLVGSLITGGKGQGVFSAAFSISGTFQDPKTTLRPLSILTPGFTRKVFERAPQSLEKTPAHPQQKHG